MPSFNRLRIVAAAALPLLLVATPTLAAPQSTTSPPLSSDVSSLPDPNAVVLQREYVVGLVQHLNLNQVLDKVDIVFAAIQQEQDFCYIFSTNYTYLEGRVDRLTTDAVRAITRAQTSGQSSKALTAPVPSAPLPISTPSKTLDAIAVAQPTPDYEAALVELERYFSLGLREADGTFDAQRPVTQGELADILEQFFTEMAPYSDPQTFLLTGHADSRENALKMIDELYDKVAEVRSQLEQLEALNRSRRQHKETDNLLLVTQAYTAEQAVDVSPEDAFYLALHQLIHYYGFDMTGGTDRLNPDQPLTRATLLTSLLGVVRMIHPFYWRPGSMLGHSECSLLYGTDMRRALENLGAMYLQLQQVQVELQALL
ncbi:hypothetical protein [Pseudanabaena sp. FACHB-2040]|uniref:hypothetical protein n=1 Tax=Pseudanabaena sp. FACHB-2040 TaxID=2692859 RepID=UPI0016822882|nr:hypothetical protein [Pseudanabaena sp. FACHB-2040]MBD2258502.1 hypothetical protein [Pseudanabaena sp. FACHB-2040]